MLLRPILCEMQAKIRIDNANPSYGVEPYTNQYGECGAEGELIHFTPEYLLNDTLIEIYGSRGEHCLYSFNIYHEIREVGKVYLCSIMFVL